MRKVDGGKKTGGVVTFPSLHLVHPPPPKPQLFFYRALSLSLFLTPWKLSGRGRGEQRNRVSASNASHAFIPREVGRESL